jgi:hypothetical protein
MPRTQSTRAARLQARISPELRNGVPLLPFRQGTPKVTSALVRQLQNESQ